jgi:hypothetical protein
VGVPLKGLLGCLGQWLEALPAPRHVQPVSCQHAVLIQRLEVEAAALARFVQKQANQQWGGSARDAPPRPIIAFHVGERRHKRAEHRWAQIPQASRHHATCYTAQYVV